MNDTSAGTAPGTVRLQARFLMLTTIVLCLSVFADVFRFKELFENEKAAQTAYQDKLAAIMLIHQSVMDLQGYVLGGDTRLTSRISDESSEFNTLLRNHPGDKDFQKMDEAFHMWQQMLAQPMMQKRHDFDTSALNFSEMGIAYIQGNAPMHQRRLAEISTQMLTDAKSATDAAHARISGALYLSIGILVLLGLPTVVLALMIWKQN